MPLTPDCEVAIVGAGLSGLATGLLLQQAGKTVWILEATASPGGRVQSLYDIDSGEFLGDLGPTWIWPSYQPLIARWVSKLGVDTFTQYTQGKVIVDRGPGQAPQEADLPHQDGSVRMVGGTQALVDALLHRLASDTLVTQSPVNSILRTDSHVELNFTTGSSLSCSHVVVAVPPRIVARKIDSQNVFEPTLIASMESIPTWMAPHAKVVAVFKEPFWRQRGLSGRLVSQSGPVVEAHDHSGPDGSPATLFGFIGWPHDVRARAGSELKQAIAEQLARCYGSQMPQIEQLHVEDWSGHQYVASPEDLRGPSHHPVPGPEALRQSHGEGRVWLASAETAKRSPGLIEGAFEAAERVSASLT